MYQYQAQTTRNGPKGAAMRFTARASELGAEKNEKKISVLGLISIMSIDYAIRGGSVTLAWANGDIIATLRGQGRFDFSRFGGITGMENVHLSTLGFQAGSSYSIDISLSRSMGSEVFAITEQPLFVSGGGSGASAGAGPVPSTIPIYKSTQTTTTDEDVTTWAGLDIGVPHPQRVVIVAGFIGVSVTSSCTVNGISHTASVGNGTRNSAIYSIPVPNGLLGDVVVTAVGSVRKAMSIYVAYPSSPAIISSGLDSQTLTTDATASLRVLVGGFVIYAGSQGATLGAFGTTWSGAESVTEDVDAQLEAASSYTTGSFAVTAASTSTLTLAETVSGTKHFVAGSFFPSA